jgi:uncharacterized membrane protein
MGRWRAVLTAAVLALAGAPSAWTKRAPMSIRAAIGVGAVTGLALGILIGVTTDVPLAPEVGLVLGAVVGWLSRRGRA